MGFLKDLFIVDENAANKPTTTEPVKKETTLSKFPTAAPTEAAPAGRRAPGRSRTRATGAL